MKKLFLPLFLLVLTSLCLPPLSAQEETDGSSAAAPAASAAAPRDPALRTSTPRALPKIKVANRIAATVNGRIITSNEVAMRLRPMAAQLAAQYPRLGPEFDKKLNERKNEVLDDLIDNELLLSEFDDRGLFMPDSVINQEVENTIRQGFGGDRKLFINALRMDGLTMREYKEQTKKRIIGMSMRSQKFDMDVPPAAAEIQKEYNRTKYQFRDMTKDKIVYEKILIPVGPPGSQEGDPDVQLSLAELIIEKINEKEYTFEEMAKNYSRDPYAQEGGLWPEKRRDELSVEFGSIVFDAPLNKVIGPLADPSGFTIVRVKKKTLASPPPLSKIKPQIEQQVRTVKGAVRYERWIKRLREQAIIKKFI